MLPSENKTPFRGKGDIQLYAQSVVADRVRSVQVDHLTDVASSDRHTVKPWFQGKLDFAPKVPDLSLPGYALSGGRLDYLTDRPVAALMNYRRLHAINVLTWPASNDEDKPVRGMTRQGFHIRPWQRSGMIYWAISNLNDQELDEFVRLFQKFRPPSKPLAARDHEFDRPQRGVVNGRGSHTDSKSVSLMAIESACCERLATRIWLANLINSRVLQRTSCVDTPNKDNNIEVARNAQTKSSGFFISSTVLDSRQKQRITKQALGAPAALRCASIQN